MQRANANLGKSDKRAGRTTIAFEERDRDQPCSGGKNHTQHDDLSAFAGVLNDSITDRQKSRLLSYVIECEHLRITENEARRESFSDWQTRAS
jgi:hypothetical protein